jgi:RNA polymerase sigma factor (sigma-70 family)
MTFPRLQPRNGDLGRFVYTWEQSHVIEPVSADEQACRPTPQALEGMFARCQGELLGTLYYLLGNWDDARDCLQETFLKCWRSRQEIGKIENLRAWIFRVAINTGRDARSTAWRRKKQPLPTEAEEHVARGPSAEAALLEGERVERLRSAIADLRDEEKEVFLLRQNGELTYEEIANLLDIPSGTVKTRMRLALERLRRVLGE